MKSNTANATFAILLEKIPWTTMQWKAGRKLPRKIFSYPAGNKGEIPILDSLIKLIENKYKTNVLSIWMNLYENGDHWTPPHKDTYGTDVYTLSFGATRHFWLQHDSTGDKLEYELANGDLFYFNEETNSQYKHCIPKTKKDVGPRISVVFFVNDHQEQDDEYDDALESIGLSILRPWTLINNEREEAALQLWTGQGRTIMESSVSQAAKAAVYPLSSDGSIKDNKTKEASNNKDEDIRRARMRYYNGV